MNLSQPFDEDVIQVAAPPVYYRQCNGKRQSRPKAKSELCIAQVPDLRIVPQDLWEAVKARQKSQAIKQSDSKAWQRRKPRFLFTGLIKCGCCGGGFSTIAKDRFGCSASRNKGTSVCTNRTTVARKDMERQILDLLSDNLMEPDLVAIFAKEYIAERNRLSAHKTDDRASKQKELTKVIKDQDVLVNALLAGTPAARINDRMSQLEARQQQLEHDLASPPVPTSNLRIHPQMAHTYHARIKSLITQLGDPNSENEARDEIRGLIDKITVTPRPTGGKRMHPQLELHGALASILALSLGAEGQTEQQTSCEQEVVQSIVFMVAGARYGHYLTSLSENRIE
ncbi:zinc ribbon domain-containing protein [Pacificibacter marinus]|uniref:zinc ribbon domain-containing protein n=1 Tax=Pacificibacter marinus TaxID=658057 RepID=UPI00339D9E4D